MKQSVLSFLAHFIYKRAKWIVAISTILTLVCLYLTAHYLRLDSNQDNLISKKLAYHSRYLDFLDKFGDTEYIFVAFSTNSQNKVQVLSAIEELATALKKHSNLYSYVAYREDISFAKNKELYLAPDSDFNKLESIERTIGLSQIKSIRDESDIYLMARQTIDKLSTMPGQVAEDSFHYFDLLFDSLESLYLNKNLTQISDRLTQRPLYQQGYFATETDSLLFLKILPIKDYESSTVVSRPLNLIRSLVSEIQLKYPELEIGITGRPVLQADEIESTGSDSFWASLASLLGVLALYLLYLKNLRKPLLIIIALLMSIFWTSGFIALTIGRLNLLSLVFGIILVGIGVDYGMHFLVRYLKFSNMGFSVKESLIKTMTSVGDSIVTGAIATSIAFFSALFCEFLGLQELGFIAGFGVLFCLVAQLIVFPALLILFSPKGLAHEVKLPYPRFWDFLLRQPGRLILIMLGLTLLSLPLVLKVSFENNLLKLQDPNLPSVIWENKILNDVGFKTYFAAMTANSLEELNTKKSKVEQLTSVSSTESLSNLLPSESRISKVSDLSEKWRQEQPFQWGLKGDPIKTSRSAEELIISLQKLQEKAFTSGNLQALEKIESKIERLQNIVNLRKIKSQEELADYHKKLGNWFSDFVNELSVRIIESPVTLDQISDNLLSRYFQKGEYVLYIYPKNNIWDWETLTDFLNQLRSVDQQVTGAPVSVYESAVRMKRGFYIVGMITTVIVLFLLFFETRSCWLTVLATLPLIAGLVWLLFWMKLFDYSLNLGNFFALPILIGLGIDNGVHLVHSYQESKNARTALFTVGPPIILSTATTILGFGALAFVRHKGLSSFGFIMALGSLTCLVAALVLIPALLQRKSHVSN